MDAVQDRGVVNLRENVSRVTENSPLTFHQVSIYVIWMGERVLWQYQA